MVTLVPPIEYIPHFAYLNTNQVDVFDIFDIFSLENFILENKN